MNVDLKDLIALKWPSSLNIKSRDLSLIALCKWEPGDFLNVNNVYSSYSLVEMIFVNKDNL